VENVAGRGSTITRIAAGRDSLAGNDVKPRIAYFDRTFGEVASLVGEKNKGNFKKATRENGSVVGFSTLVHLWRVAGESAYIGMKQIFPKQQ